MNNMELFNKIKIFLGIISQNNSYYINLLS